MAVDSGRGGRVVAGAVGGAARCSRNFSEYEQDRRSRLADEATRPQRITYRKLTR